MKKIIITITLVVLIVIAGVIAWPKIFGERAVYCTLDAKLCPDGSYVGRVPPNCEFALCPTEGLSGIKGIVLLGPVCPVMREPPDPQCADKPYQTNLVVTTPDGARVVTEFASDLDGQFKVNVAPGEYAISSATAGNILPFCRSNGTVKVNADEFTDETVYCDTGIR